MKLSQYLRADLHRNFSLEVTERIDPSRSQLLRRALSPRFAPVLLIRVAQAAARSGLGPVAKLVSTVNYVIFGIEVGLKCEIGPGLYLPHTVGTVIGAAKIGRNAMIFQGVTLGAKSLDIGYTATLRPVLADGVTIGAGAKVLGGLTVGDYAVVGANAVVTRDVPAGQGVVGNPARPMDRQRRDAVQLL